VLVKEAVESAESPLVVKSNGENINWV
jgi:hypothetical protein